MPIAAARGRSLDPTHRPRSPPVLRRVKHVEFEAVHRPTNQTFAVEAKSRHRADVLHQPGDADADDPLRGDPRAVHGLFKKAISKTHDASPYFIFIDINAPLDAELNEHWQSGVQKWMSQLPQPPPESPDVFNALFVTNSSPHYDVDCISREGSWLAVLPAHVATSSPPTFDRRSIARSTPTGACRPSTVTAYCSPEDARRPTAPAARRLRPYGAPARLARLRHALKPRTTASRTQRGGRGSWRTPYEVSHARRTPERRGGPSSTRRGHVVT